jgi:branched-subunit amino acid aminotransferase/4-amino-4-deoxychorismate lyase
MNEPSVYLNGQWLPESNAALSLVDAGFVLGATIAEQLRTFHGKLFRLDDHLGRLEHSLKLVGIDLPVSRALLAELAREIVARNHPLLASGDDLGLSIFVTPGEYPAYSSSPQLPGTPISRSASDATLCLHTYPLPFRYWADKYRTGQLLATTDIRQVPAECWPPAIKCRSRMHYYLADRQAAQRHPGARALLLDFDGNVTEASTANVLLYRRAEGLVSPPRSKILHGISLMELFEVAAALEISRVERDFTPQEAADADEVLLTSTPFCVLPCTSLNGRAIGSGQPGEIFHRLLAAWSEIVGVEIVHQAERFCTR